MTVYNISFYKYILLFLAIFIVVVEKYLFTVSV